MCAKETDDDTIVEMPTQEETPTKTTEERLATLEKSSVNPVAIQQVINSLAQDLQTANLRIQVMEGHIMQLRKEQDLTGVVRERNDEILVRRILAGMREEYDGAKEEK